MRKAFLLLVLLLALVSVQVAQAQEASALSATVRAVGQLYTYDWNSTIQVEVTNNGAEEYSGKIYVLASYKPEMGFVDGNIDAQSSSEKEIVVPAHSSASFTTTLYIAPLSMSDRCEYYYFAVYDKDEKEIASAVKLAIDKYPKPKLAIVSAETNATPGDYDTENCPWGGYKLKVPRVNDDYAWVKLGFRNVGSASAGKIKWRMDATNQITGERYSKRVATVNIPDDGSIIYFEVKWTPAEVGGSFMSIDITTEYMDSRESPMQLVGMDDYMRVIPRVDDERYGVRVPANIQWLYVAGKPVGIDNVEQTAGLAVAGGEGELLVRSDRAERISVFAIDGRTVSQVSVQPGVESRVSLPAGMYIVKGVKVLVR